MTEKTSCAKITEVILTIVYLSLSIDAIRISIALYNNSSVGPLIYKFVYTVNLLPLSILSINSAIKASMIYAKLRKHGPEFDEFAGEIYAIVEMVNIMEGTRYTIYNTPRKKILEILYENANRHNEFGLTVLYRTLIVFFFGYGVYITDVYIMVVLATIMVLDGIYITTNRYSGKKLYEIYSKTSR